MADLPSTGRAIDTETLLRLETAARDLGLSQRLTSEWLAQNVAATGVHLAVPVLMHRLTHRPELPDQVRCLVFLRTRGGERVQSLLDVLPSDFEALPAFSKAERNEADHLMSDATVRSVREYHAGAD